MGDSAGRLGEAGLGKDCDHGGAASGCIEARPLAVCLKDSTGDDLVFRVHQMRWRLGLGRPGLPAWLLTDLVNCGRQPKKKGGSVAAFRRRSTRWREPLRPTSTGDPSTLGLLWHTGTTLTTIWQLLRGSTTAIPVGCVSGKDQDGRVRIQDRSRV